MGDSILAEINRRWKSGKFIEVEAEVSKYEYKHLPAISYEGYMFAYILEGGELERPCLMIVEFPGNKKEEGRLHNHRYSGRVIVILTGAGEFVVRRNGTLERHQLKPGMKIWMPPATDHNFEAGPEGLVVSSLHTKYYPPGDPRCLEFVEEEQP